MTRKEFIAHLGMVLFVVSGFSTLLKTLSNPDPLKKENKTARPGFGKGVYGA